MNSVRVAELVIVIFFVAYNFPFSRFWKHLVQLYSAFIRFTVRIPSIPGYLCNQAKRLLRKSHQVVSKAYNVIRQQSLLTVSCIIVKWFLKVLMVPFRILYRIIKLVVIVVKELAITVKPLFSLTVEDKLVLPKALLMLSSIGMLAEQAIAHSNFELLIVVNRGLFFFSTMYIFYHYFYFLFVYLEKMSKILPLIIGGLCLFAILILTCIGNFLEKGTNVFSDLALTFAMAGPFILAMFVWSVRVIGRRESGHTMWGGIRFMVAPMIFIVGLYTMFAVDETALIVINHPEYQSGKSTDRDTSMHYDISESIDDIVHFRRNSNTLVRDISFIIPSANHAFVYGARTVLSADDSLDKNVKGPLTQKEIKIRVRKTRSVIVMAYIVMVLYTAILIVFVTRTFEGFNPGRSSLEDLMDIWQKRTLNTSKGVESDTKITTVQLTEHELQLLKQILRRNHLE